MGVGYDFGIVMGGDDFVKVFVLVFEVLGKV